MYRLVADSLTYRSWARRSRRLSRTTARTNAERRVRLRALENENRIQKEAAEGGEGGGKCREEVGTSRSLTYLLTSPLARARAEGRAED